MSDWNELIRFAKAGSKAEKRFPLVLLKNEYKGRVSWSWAGSIPVELCHLTISGYSEVHVSNIYETREDAVKAAGALQITDFRE